VSCHWINYRQKTVGDNCCTIVRLSSDAILWWDYLYNWQWCCVVVRLFTANPATTCTTDSDVVLLSGCSLLILRLLVQLTVTLCCCQASAQLCSGCKDVFYALLMTAMKMMVGDVKCPSVCLSDCLFRSVCLPLCNLSVCVPASLPEYITWVISRSWDWFETVGFMSQRACDV